MADAAALFDSIAPELASEASKSDWIDLADSQTGKVYGAQREYAVALLAAHTGTVAQREGMSGAINSRKEGQLSVGFSGPQTNDELAATSYGAELLRLRRQMVFSARTVIV